MLLVQAGIYPFPEKSIDHGHCRDKDQHTHKSHQAAAQGNSHQHPYGRKSHRASHHMRIDQISLNLLKDQEESQEQHRLHGAYHKDQEKGNPASDNSSKQWDQGCETDQHSHQHGIREPENGHRNKKHASQDHSLNTLSCNKAGENPVGQIPYMCQVAHRLFRQKSIQGLFHLTKELFLGKKYIAGKHKANGYIHSCAQQSHGNGYCGGNKIIDAVFQYSKHRINNLSRLNVQRLGPLYDLRIIFKCSIDPLLDHRYIFLYLFGNTHQSCTQLRHYHQHNNDKHTDQETNGKHQTYRSGKLHGCFFLLLYSLAKEMLFNKFHRHIQNKGDSASQNKRNEKAQKYLSCADHNIQMLDTQIQKYGKGNEITYFFHVFLV